MLVVCVHCYALLNITCSRSAYTSSAVVFCALVMCRLAVKNTRCEEALKCWLVVCSCLEVLIYSAINYAHSSASLCIPCDRGGVVWLCTSFCYLTSVVGSKTIHSHLELLIECRVDQMLTTPIAFLSVVL